VLLLVSQARALAASNEQLERRIAATAIGAAVPQPDAAPHPEAAASKLPNGVARQQPAPEHASAQQPEGQQQEPGGGSGATSEGSSIVWCAAKRTYLPGAGRLGGDFCECSALGG
jgi:hypothetical protein